MSSQPVPQRMHPYRFIMYLSLITMIMYFAALSSAYIVKRAQAQWFIIELPVSFYVATAIILISSLTMHMSVRVAKLGDLKKTQRYTLITLILGLGFISAQIEGFRFLMAHGVHLEGNVAGAFIYLIAWSHIAHVIAGIVSLTWIYVLQRMREKTSPLSLGVISIFWHFIDIIWIYLLSLLLILR